MSSLPLAATLPEAITPAPGVVQVSQRLGRFVLLHKLGAGGMGTVFSAYDEQLDRKVALKLLHPMEHEQAASRQRVLREAQAMARVSDQNVVHVYEVGELGEQIFIAMEYIDGVTLGDWQKRQPRSWQELLRMYRQAGEGLLAAHQTGLVHRDFKPDNVLVDKLGRAHVADFGLARLQGVAVGAAEPLPQSSSPSALHSPITASGVLSGTPGYMSPEQYRGEVTDSRSDQFSYCVALYEALFRRSPYAGSTIAEVAAAVVSGKLREPPADSPVPLEVKRALFRGLAVDPKERFPTMAELLAALDVVAERDPAGARRARWRISAALAVATVITNFTAGNRFFQNIPGVGDAVIVMAVVIGIFLGGIALFHKSLFANQFHRGLSLLLLVGLTMILGVRYLIFCLHLTMGTMIPIDLMIMAGVVSTVALQYLPGLRWLGGAMAVAAFAAVKWPGRAIQLGFTAYTLLPIVFIYSWMSLGKNRGASAQTKDRPRPPASPPP